MGNPLKEGLGHGDWCVSQWILGTVHFWHDLGRLPIP